MKKIGLLCLMFLLIPLATAQELNLDEVIKKHLEARGGLKNWQNVKNMKLEGSFTGFSVTKPFTLYRTADGKVNFDHHWGDWRVQLGHDGQSSWWVNEAMSKLPGKVPPPEEPVVKQWGQLVTPFFNYKERGYKLEFLGKTDLEGEPALGIKVTYQNGVEETWYLDPKTFLELGRISPGADFGRPQQQTTWFADFREVNGLKIPFFQESMFGIRHRVMQVEKAELNVDVQGDMFEQPYPQEMNRLKNLVGDWEVTISEERRGKTTERQTESTIEPLLDGKMFMERIDTGQSNIVRTWNHDQFRERYTIVATDDFYGFSNIFHGSWKDNGIEADNLESDTSVSQRGTAHHRIKVTDVTPDSFIILSQTTIDGGKKWRNQAKFTYRRKKK